MPSVSPTGENFIHVLVLPTFNHAADFILLAFSMRVIKSYASGSPALLFEPYSADLNFPALSILSRRESYASARLAHPILRSSRCSHPSCPRNPMRGREVYASDPSSFILCGGLLIPRFTHLIPCHRPKSTLQTSSFFLSISHAGESHLLRRSHLRCLQYFCKGEFHL